VRTEWCETVRRGRRKFARRLPYWDIPLRQVTSKLSPYSPCFSPSLSSLPSPVSLPSLPPRPPIPSSALTRESLLVACLNKMSQYGKRRTNFLLPSPRFPLLTSLSLPLLTSLPPLPPLPLLALFLSPCFLPSPPSLRFASLSSLPSLPRFPPSSNSFPPL
jgi:hypothetical protein